MPIPSLLACVVALALQAPPNPTTSPTTSPTAHHDWLKSNAIPLRTIEPSLDDRPADFSDLAPLKAIIGDARMVLLGEQTHGDGATFVAKTRLIEFLHAEMGFDVLCFESGLYDCDRAWRSFEQGSDAYTAMRQGVFAIWTGAEELRPLTRFLDLAKAAGKPMELCGYDCQLTGSASNTQLLPDITALNASGSPPVLRGEAIQALSSMITSLGKSAVPPDDVRSAGEEALRQLHDALDQPAYAAVSARDRSFWKRVLTNLVGLSEHLVASRAKQSLAASFNTRDRYGGETLRWLATERYPNRKIIVWAASMHCLRDHASIQPLTPNLNYAGVRSAGDVAAETLKDDLFVIAFTTGPGMVGRFFDPTPRALPAPLPESLEALCASLSFGPAIIPLRGAAEGSFGASSFIARPLGNAPMRATWQRHLDAFVFTPTMFPATSRRGEEDYALYRNLIPGLTADLQRYRERVAAKDPFGQKGGFDSAWSTWRAIRRPDREALVQAQAEVVAWAEPLANDANDAWRAHWLLSTVSADLGDTPKAITHLDAAMASYPGPIGKDPARHSAYQHMVNARAMLVWKDKGQDQAAAWFADRVANDDRLTYVFLSPWLEQLKGDLAGRARLRDALRVAFEARAARLPQQAEAIRQLATDTDAVFDRE